MSRDLQRRRRPRAIALTVGIAASCLVVFGLAVFCILAVFLDGAQKAGQ